ncbi:MAG: type I-E CRISPR-associated protein Cas7/Cse4/CasC, partial [candidate division WOR-3 bacterium]
TFVQMHLLTSYPPSNLNRDDLGRPKTAVMGGVQRLRISSQSLKRAWRTSEVFQTVLSGKVGTRTKCMGKAVFEALSSGRTLSDVLENRQPNKLLDKVKEDRAKELARTIAAVFGELEVEDNKDPLKGLQIKQLTHFNPDEISAIESLVENLRKRSDKPTENELLLLRKNVTAADIALFGRMLASKPEYNVEAAAQVAHAITVHKVAVEDDYFTAVDDLNRGEEDMGAGHIGETEFAAGLFYLYICVDRDLLLENLKRDESLTKKALCALAECASSVAPTGKQNSFASRAYASYALAEKGTQQPRSLSVAFLKPVTGPDMLLTAIEALENTKANMDKVYGRLSDVYSCKFNVVNGEGTLKDVLEFVSKPLCQERGQQ